MTDTPSHIGLRIDNRYLIEAKLGSGGMATVYRATRLHIGDTVAIKILHPGQVDDPQSVERFRREAQAAARLKHPNVVPIYDFGVAGDGLVYIAMELVEGKTIRELLHERGPFAPREATEIITQVCSALEAAHKKNIVHRDIKPDNIVVDSTPAGISVKVLDFGIAWMRHVAAASITETGNIVGTPHYMSPEQCLGEEPDPRSDIYSVGIVLFEMLAGVVPFNSRVSTAVVIQHVNEPPPSLRAIKSEVPRAVESVVMHALAKRREQRQQSAALLAAELTAAVSEGSVGPKRATPTSETIATTVKMPMPDWNAERQKSSSFSARSKGKSLLWASAGGVVLLAVAFFFITKPVQQGPIASGESVPTITSPIKSPPRSSDSTISPSIVFGVDSGRARRDTSQAVSQRTTGGVVPQLKDIVKAATQSAENALGGQQQTDRKTSMPEVPPAVGTPKRRVGASGETTVRKPEAKASVASPIRDSVVSTATPISTTATSAAPKNVAATSVAEKNATPPNLPTPRSNLAASATQAAGNCLDALRSNNIERMTQLYSTASAQDDANRAKLLARMRDAASRLTATGSPDIGSAQTFADSAYTDFAVRLTWRGNFGQTVNKTARFRATIAQTEGDSHISCRIIGKADL